MLCRVLMFMWSGGALVQNSGYRFEKPTSTFCRPQGPGSLRKLFSGRTAAARVPRGRARARVRSGSSAIGRFGLAIADCPKASQRGWGQGLFKGSLGLVESLHRSWWFLLIPLGLTLCMVGNVVEERGQWCGLRRYALYPQLLLKHCPALSYIEADGRYNEVTRGKKSAQQFPNLASGGSSASQPCIQA